MTVKENVWVACGLVPVAARSLKVYGPVVTGAVPLKVAVPLPLSVRLSHAGRVESGATVMAGVGGPIAVTG